MSWTTAVAWGLGALTPALIAVAIVLDPGNRRVGIEEFAVGLQALVGTLLGWRRPRNPIGWIFVVTAAALEFSFYNGGVAQRLAVILLATAPTTALAIERIAAGIGSFATNIVIALPLLLFPKGHLQSQRWRPVVILQIGMAAFAFFWEGFARPTVPLGGAEYANPLAISALHDAYAPGVGVGELVSVLILLAIATGLFRRYRRSPGVEREQLKCLALGAGFTFLAGATTIAAVIILGSSGDPPAWALDILRPIVSALLIAPVPVAMGIAIFRYRLYDIDVLINRTVVYGATTAAIAGTFFAGIVALQAVLRPLTAGQELAVAASTLGSFALFQPIRRAIQRRVDRRFNRARYDASRALDSFADHLRDEVDLDSVRSDLLAAVGETMAPVHASLWLRERTP
jgi:hypothetical protein